MSVIAWDGKSIVADKMMTEGDFHSVATKLYKLDHGVIVGFAGDLAQGLMLMDWYTGGQKKDDFPKFQATDEWTRLIVVKEKRLFIYDKLPVPIPIRDEYHAFGCGRDYAIGAMAMGATAREAVEITCKHSVYCGNGIDEFALNE